MLPEEGEHLATGWEDDLAPTDSLVRQAVLAHVSWARALTTAARGTFAEGPDWCAGRGGGPSALHNWAIVTRPPRDWAQTVGAIATAYPDGVAALVISPFPTPDLTRHGLGLVGHPPLMFRPTATATTTPATPLDVREATTGEQPGRREGARRGLPDAGHGRPATLRLLPPGGRGRPDQGLRRLRRWDPGRHRGRALGRRRHRGRERRRAPSARGQGAGAALTWAATTAWPGQPAVLIASDDGQPVYERLGYLRLERWTCWLRP